MISNTLVICIAVGSAAIVIALMMWKPRRRLPANAVAEQTRWHDAMLPSMILSFAATIGLARARAEQTGGSNNDGYSWHGSHLDHGSHGGHADGGGFSGGGGDAGGGGI